MFKSGISNSSEAIEDTCKGSKSKEDKNPREDLSQISLQFALGVPDKF